MPYDYIITVLLGALNLMILIALYWLRHYIQANDREHQTIFQLIDELNKRYIEHLILMTKGDSNAKTD
jgi:hypothetical protein